MHYFPSARAPARASCGPQRIKTALFAPRTRFTSKFGAAAAGVLREQTITFVLAQKKPYPTDQAGLL